MTDMTQFNAERWRIFYIAVRTWNTVKTYIYENRMEMFLASENIWTLEQELVLSVTTKVMKISLKE